MITYLHLFIIFPQFIIWSKNQISQVLSSLLNRTPVSLYRIILILQQALILLIWFIINIFQK